MEPNENMKEQKYFQNLIDFHSALWINKRNNLSNIIYYYFEFLKHGKPRKPSAIHFHFEGFLQLMRFSMMTSLALRVIICCTALTPLFLAISDNN